MGRLREWGRRLSYLGRRARLERELAEEIAFHVQARADELLEAGVPQAEALARASREFGSAWRAREGAHRAWQIAWLEDLVADLRYALRTLRRSPAFTATAIATLALGIGANTAIFSVVDAVLLKPLPYDRPDAVMVLAEKTPQFEQGSVWYLNFRDWQVRNRAFEALAAFRGDDFVLNTAAGPARVPGRLVSGEFFSVLGVAPAAGRLFSPADDQAGAVPAAVISHRLWQTRFAGDRGIVGKAVTISDRRYTVVGVAPARFWFYSQSDVFLPIGLVHESWTTVREMRSGLFVVGRLKRGVTVAQAAADMHAVARGLAAEYPKANTGHEVAITPILADAVGDNARLLFLLLGAVGFVLLIACANVGNLLVARASSREREIAIRAALGAGGGRVVRQLLTEALLLAVVGAVVALAVVAGTVHLLIARLPASLPRTDAIGVDLRVLFFTLGLTIVTGFVFGLLPALKAVRANVGRGLNERSQTGGRRSHVLQDLLVTSQLGLALLLLIGAGLMLQSVTRLWQVNPGFTPRNLLTFNVWLSPVRYDSAPKARAFYSELLQRLGGLPGVEAAGMSTDVPFRGDSEVFFHVAEHPRPSEKDLPWAMFYPVSSGYARAMGLTLLRGRFFGERDTATSEMVVVVDEELVRGLFHGEDPVGKHLVIPFKGLDQPREIVGVVRHVKHWGLAQDDHAKVRYQFYMPFWQIPDEFWTEAAAGATVLLRSAQDRSALVAAASAQVRRLDKDQPVYNVSTMTELIDASLAAERLAMWLLGLFAGLAAVLAAVGTYGVVSYSVSRRTNEIGIRMALGATRAAVLRLVVGAGVRRALVGIGLGIAAAIALTHLLSSLLFTVSATDPLAFTVSALGLLGVSLVATLIPALRAVRIDPTIALRAE